MRAGVNVTKVVVTSVLSHAHLLVPGRSTSMSATHPRLCALASWNSVRVLTCAVFGRLHILTWTTPFWEVFTVGWYGNEPADQNVNEYAPWRMCG